MHTKRSEFHLACSLYRFKILCTAIANFSSSVNELSGGSPSRIRIVRRISLGITTRPKSSPRVKYSPRLFKILYFTGFLALLPVVEKWIEWGIKTPSLQKIIETGEFLPVSTLRVAITVVNIKLPFYIQWVVVSNYNHLYVIVHSWS